MVRRALILFSAICLFEFLATPLVAAPAINISLVGSHKPSQSGFGDVWGDGNIACMGVWLSAGYNNGWGTGIYNISNPSSPTLLTTYNYGSGVGNRFEQGVLRSNILYLGSWGGSGNGSGLHILSMNNPAAPVLLSRITKKAAGTVTNGFDDVHTLWVERNFLYLAAHNPGIVSVKVFDISNPSLPVYLSDVVTTNTTKVHQITVGMKGTNVILYTSGWGGNDNSNPNSYGQTDLWDVNHIGTQPANWLGRVYSGYNSHSSYPTPDGNTLVVCRETPGGEVSFYDISTPPNPSASAITNPSPIAVISPARMGLEADIPHNPVIIGNLLFLSWYQNGLQIFDITDRTKPVRIGSYDTYPNPSTSSYQGNWGIDPKLGLNKLLVSDINNGFFILDASAVLTNTNNYPPLLISDPDSLTVTQGMNATFTAAATGSSLSYQWKFNGATISGATGSSFVLSNAQPVNAGNYTVQITNTTGAVTSSIASLSVVFPEPATEVVFSENFDSVSSSNNWNLFDGADNGISDYTVDWSYDYSTYFSSFNGMNIPPAPNSTNGTTRGLRLTVNNNDAIKATAGVSVYPKTATFNGAYKLKFDLWMNYPGNAGGNGSGVTGSTENATFGINHTGTRVNWASSNPSDGIWFTVDGEGGDSNNKDYRAYVGNLSGAPALLSFADSGFSASGAASADNSDSHFQSVFPSPAYETSGSPGKHWVQVEISRDASNLVKWKMNDQLIAQRIDTSSFTNGTIMLGYMDLFTSIANPAADTFVLFDNVRVEAAVTGTAPHISTPPQNVPVYQGQNATFSVAATGTGPLNFQWRFNNTDIFGANENSLTISNTEPEQVGNYSVVVSNAYGTATSSNATLTIIDSPFLSNVQATPGERGALISWNTVYLSDSLVQFDVANIAAADGGNGAAQGASFGNSSYIDRNMTTNHTMLLTGLAPNTSYHFQVISTSETNTYFSAVYQFTTAGSTIVDNPDATYTGSWTLGTSAPDKYLNDYQFADSIAGAATASATFRPNLPTAGNYDVSVWYSIGGNRATNAPYSIFYDGGSTTVPVNQQIKGGQWNLIGANLPFAAGNAGFVRLANNAGNSVVIADAVQFTYADAQETPSDNSVPKWWADFYGVVDPLDDPDHDGYTTADEYLLGTSPTDGNSHLQLDVQASGGSANITFWPYLGNRNYKLLFKTNLTDVSWQELSPGSITPTQYGHGIFSLSTSTTFNGFYRLGVQPVATGDFSGSLAVPQGDVNPGFSEAACGISRIYAAPR